MWSGTRGSLLAIAAAPAAALVLFRFYRWRRILFSTAAAFLLAVPLSMAALPESPLYGLARLADSFEPQKVEEVGLATGRVEHWKYAAGKIAERPLFGHGTSQYQAVRQDPLNYNHPHNALLQVAFDWGLVGAALFFGLLGALLWRGHRAAAAAPREALPAWLCAVSLLTIGLYDGALYYPYPVTMILFSAVYLVTLRPSEKRAGAVGL